MILNRLFKWFKYYFLFPTIKPSLDCFKNCYKIYLEYFIDEINLLCKVEQYEDNIKKVLYLDYCFQNMLYCKEKMGTLICEKEPEAKIWANYKISRQLYYEFMDYKKEYDFLFGATDSMEETFKRAKIYLKKLNAEKDFE